MTVHDPIYHVAKVAESQRAVQTANRELAQTKKEFEEYKKRAAGILQVSGLLMYCSDS